MRLGPGGRTRLILIAAIAVQDLPVKLKKFDSTLSIRLAEFARELQVRCVFAEPGLLQVGPQLTAQLALLAPISGCSPWVRSDRARQTKSAIAAAGPSQGGEEDVPVREIPMFAKVCQAGPSRSPDRRCASLAAVDALPQERDFGPVRTAMQVCRSAMELGNKHINFGLMSKNELREKTLVVKNLSEMPLLYRIRKSGSVASSTSCAP